MINAKQMTKNQIVSSVRRLLRDAKKNDIIPVEWKISVSSGWAGFTPKIILKIKNHGFCCESNTRSEYESKLYEIVNYFNYNDSMIEFDHFDVGYYSTICWM